MIAPPYVGPDGNFRSHLWGRAAKDVDEWYYNAKDPSKVYKKAGKGSGIVDQGNLGKGGGHPAYFWFYTDTVSKKLQDKYDDLPATGPFIIHVDGGSIAYKCMNEAWDPRPDDGVYPEPCEGEMFKLTGRRYTLVCPLIE